MTFEKYSECAEALRDGRVDAVSTDNVILLGLIQQSDDAFELVGKPFSTEPYGIGVKLRGQGAARLRQRRAREVVRRRHAGRPPTTPRSAPSTTPHVEPPAVDRYS